MGRNRRDKRPAIIPPVKAVGAEGYKRSDSLVYEEFHAKLKGRKAQRVYREMADNSAIAGALLWLLECLVTQADQNVEVDAKNDGEPTALYYRDRVDEMFDDMRSTRTAFFSDVCSMFVYGYSYFETTYKLRRGPDGPDWCNSKYDDGLIGWGDHQIRVQESIDRWEWCDNQLTGAWQRPYPDLQERFLPLNGWSDKGAPVQCLHFKMRHARGNPEGKSLLRNAYKSYWHAARFEDLEGLGAWRDMAGVLTQEVPYEWLTSGATEGQRQAVENLRSFVERANRGEYDGLVVPSKTVPGTGDSSGFDTYLMQGAGRKPMDMDPVVRRHESRIALSMLGEVVLLGTGGSGNTGSWALSSSKTAMLARGVRAMLTNIEDVINRFAIPRLMQFNNWDYRLAPRFSFGDIESDESIELLGALAQASAAGLVVPGRTLERYLRERFGLPLEEEPAQGSLAPLPPVVPPEAAPEAAPPEGGEPPAGDLLSDEEEDEAEEALEHGMTVEEAAAMARVSPNVIRSAIAAGQLPGAKVGRSYRVINTDLREYMRGSGRAR